MKWVYELKSGDISCKAPALLSLSQVIALRNEIEQLVWCRLINAVEPRSANSASNPCGGCRWEVEPNGPCNICIRAPRPENVTDKYESVPARLA